LADLQRVYVNDESFIRGAARILWAGSTVAFPTKIADVVNMSLYDATTGWNELGATKTGIQIAVNNSEETFDVDQIRGNIQTQPNDWDVSVQTALAEMTLDRLAIAWEGYPVFTDSTPTSGAEKVTHFGAPTSYTERRLAVLFQRPSGKLRGFFFRKVNRAPQESAITFNKTGEQISVPVRFNALPDLSVSEERQRFFTIRDQV
jgi:hypothetical protein